MINQDFATRLTAEKFEALKPQALAFIDDCLEESEDWNRCYGLKQRFTANAGYCFQADFYEYLKLAGLPVMIDGQGDHLVKARYRS